MLTAEIQFPELYSNILVSTLAELSRLKIKVYIIIYYYIIIIIILYRVCNEKK